MGYWKRRLLEQQERGYTPPPDRYVCPACVTDPDLASVLISELEDVPCSYCGAEPAADITILLDEVGDAILADYADPAEELPYESREGGYQGTVLDGDDLVYELSDWTESDDLLHDVAQAFAGSAWCERDYFRLNDFDALRLGWSEFADQVKHRTRYLFLEELGDSDWADPGEIPPGKMMEVLGDVFLKHASLRRCPLAAEFIRARVIRAGERPNTARDLGTAPAVSAIAPNRMSPAGIPMFYAAADADTAVAETYHPSLKDGPRDIALARFSSTKALLLLDLTSLPPVPSDFDAERRSERAAVAFLRAFEEELTRPVARDDRAHVEYVPTQVVTEYVRHRLQTQEKETIDGIVYRSSRYAGGTAFVLFADPEDCGPREDRKPYEREPFLILVAVEYKSAGEFGHLF